MASRRRRARNAASSGRVTPLWTTANSSELSRASTSSSRSIDRNPLADTAQQLVADAMAKRIIDRLEMVEAEHQHRHLFGVTAGAQQDVVHLLAQQIAVRQPGQPVMLGHASQPRFGALAFGGVDQRQQDRWPVAVNELTRIDRQVDQRTVGADMLPGARRTVVTGPWQFGVEGLQAADRQLLEFASTVTVVLDRRIVDGENALIAERADDHRNRIASNSSRNEASRCFNSVISTPTDDAAVLGQTFIDQDDAAVGQRLLMPLAGLEQLLEPRGDPFFLAADGLRIIAAHDADANCILQPRALLEQVRTAGVHLRIFLVPENIAAFGIEKHDALRQDVDRLPQAIMRFARLGKRGINLGALARVSPAAAGRLRPRLAGSLGKGFTGRPRKRTIAACLGFPRVLRFFVDIARPTPRIAASDVCRKVSEKRYLLPQKGRMRGSPPLPAGKGGRTLCVYRF